MLIWRRQAVRCLAPGQDFNQTTYLGEDKESRAGYGSISSLEVRVNGEANGGGAVPVDTEGGTMDLSSSRYIRPEDIVLPLGYNEEMTLLGRGGFGNVYKGVIHGVQEVAVKAVCKPGPDFQFALLKETVMLEHITKDRNIVQFYDWSLSGNDLFLVMELMHGRDLWSVLSDSKVARELSWGQRVKSLALNIAQGLVFLHANAVIHRDMKSKNILLGVGWQVAKIGDVGTTALVQDTHLSLQYGEASGTLAWAAPELLMGTRITSKVDIYSLGVVLW